MKSVFITGTDTGVGKSVVCGALAGYLLNNGYSAVTQKWVQTGLYDCCADISVHLKLMGKKQKDMSEHLPYMNRYAYGLPASPHLAAGIEKKKINPVKIKSDFRRLSKRFDFVIVEGIGGLLVPYNRKNLLVDIVKELKLPVIIVAENKLSIHLLFQVLKYGHDPASITAFFNSFTALSTSSLLNM